MASLGLGALGEPAFHDLLEPVLGDAATIGGFGLAAAVAFLIITTFHVVVGELAPKSLAIARTAPGRLGPGAAVAGVLSLHQAACGPLQRDGQPVAEAIRSASGVRGWASAPQRRRVARAAAGELARRPDRPRGAGALRGRAHLRRRACARGNEAPRRDRPCVHDRLPARIAEHAIATGRTRLPLYGPDRGLGSALGVVNAKDLLPLILRGAGEHRRLGAGAAAGAHLGVGARRRGAARDARETPAPRARTRPSTEQSSGC
jgi:CBS domain containing-hemolysin-like protein